MSSVLCRLAETSIRPSRLPHTNIRPPCAINRPHTYNVMPQYWRTFYTMDSIQAVQDQMLEKPVFELFGFEEFTPNCFLALQHTVRLAGRWRVSYINHTYDSHHNFEQIPTACYWNINFTLFEIMWQTALINNLINMSHIYISQGSAATV